uniref:DNA-directed DNA polymerase n=1 Tax=Tanacetum cinerariifolium TaxID=118510 RepID=A0A6L2KCI1_TANCI|nr:DNA-directed DNA polymerase [Tanacetum cinerariifolium]
MDDEPMWAADHVVSLTLGSAITISEIANEFAIKGKPLTLVKGNQFNGRTKTDPHKHIHEFLRIYDMFKYRDTENEAVRLMIFPLSLTREAKTWLDELNKGTRETWNELRTALISRFFPPTLFDRLLEEIQAFSQQENESLIDVWLRMKEMLRNCHGHNLSKGNIIKIFYHEVLNAAVGGISLYKTPNQAYQLLQDKVLLKLDWAKNQKTKSSLKKTVAFANEDSNCNNWRSNDWNSYNRDNYRTYPDDKPYDLQKQFNNFMKSQQSTNAFDKEIFMDPKTQLGTVAKNHQASIQNLETKLDRLADKQSGRPSGSLPSNTQPNPKGHNSKACQPPQARNEHVNAVFTRSAGMPNYEKFLKELICNKHKIKQIYVAFLSDESSTMIQNKVPPKVGDPRSFLIPCNFNRTLSCNALADLGASIKLMPYSLYAILSLETLKPTKMSVRLADRSFQYPVRIAENMLVEVGKFTFPADFVILEMEEASKVPLILGRPFLHVADAVIQVKQKQLNLKVGTERMIFNIDYALKHSYSNDDISFSIDVIDEILEEDPLFHRRNPSRIRNKITINTNYKIKTSLEESPTDLELKPILDNLEYVFLKEPSFLPVIISSQLSKEKKNKLVSVLKKQKQAFAWKTIDIIGICPSFCKHKIQLLDDKNLIVRKQRRLNPNMQEVVKNEIVKLLNTDIIYLIVDSPWVSPIHSVTKKGGITVATNENDELVPTRTGFSSCSKLEKMSLHGQGRNCAWTQDFSKSARPLTKLLEKDTMFKFDDECQKASELLKEKLTCAPVIISPKWNLPFELMRDASDFAIGALLEIKDRKGTENVAADHLSRIENDQSSDDSEVDDNFPRETLMEINTKDAPWFADFANYLVGDVIPKGMAYQQKNNFFFDLKHYFWEEPYLFKALENQLLSVSLLICLWKHDYIERIPSKSFMTTATALQHGSKEENMQCNMDCNDIIMSYEFSVEDSRMTQPPLL